MLTTAELQAPGFSSLFEQLRFSMNVGSVVVKCAHGVSKNRREVGLKGTSRGWI